jgi:eukaryotic-like serine/threonine-protein kinase
MSENSNIDSIFCSAIDIESPEGRDLYLQQICGDDKQLRSQLTRLLNAHFHGGSILDSPASAFVSSLDHPISEKPGTMIGPYKLLDQIGEGGFGVVYVAEQERPVRRKVALKIIKPGMDTRQVIGRFEAERQALALMDHPNIAKVFDAGATETGRSYFVMELVQGVPITEYCDQCNLTTRERLELFITVCQAVQHAHQKGVIHRDIKPTNVLVAIQDGQPATKIIDFGVAKAIDQRLTERTLTCAFAQMVGTPLYMSPEQAELSALGVDTRSDIYSLGVLLYELLTGATPFDQDRLRSASYDELRRIIRDEEPPRPSARLHSLFGSLALAGRDGEGVSATETAALASTIAEHRRTDARRLSHQVRGELDWIVMKCLEKDRNRRYETATDLSRDIERYLHDEPVQACPPSAAYRLKKFISRNKAGVLSGTAIAALLVGAMVVLIVSNARIRRESDAKEASLATTREAVRQMARLETQLDLRLNDIPDGESISRAMREDTLRYLEPIVKQAEIDDESSYEVFVILECIADIQSDLGRREEARRTCQRAIDIVQRRLDGDPESPIYLADLARAKACMVRLMYFGGLPEENEPEFVAYCEELVELLREYNRRYPNSLQPMAFYLNALGSIKLDRHGDKIAAERLFRESVVLSKEYLSQRERSAFEWEQSAKSAVQLGRLLQVMSAEGPKEAAPMFEIAVQWAKTGLAITPSKWTRLAAANAELDLGVCYFEMQPSEHAISIVRRASSELRRLSIDHPSYSILIGPARQGQAALVRQLLQLGRTDDAAEAARDMEDWLKEITRRAPNDAYVQKGLQRAQMETIELLRATNQESKAVPDN